MDKARLPLLDSRGSSLPPPPEGLAAEVQATHPYREEKDPDALRTRIVEALRTVQDPEIPLNLYDLGLIYGIGLGPEGRVDIQMTLTAPGCPVADTLVREVAQKVAEVEGVSRSRVRLTWDPPWTQERMSLEARLELGLL